MAASLWPVPAFFSSAQARCRAVSPWRTASTVVEASSAIRPGTPSGPCRSSWHRRGPRRRTARPTGPYRIRSPRSGYRPATKPAASKRRVSGPLTNSTTSPSYRGGDARRDDVRQRDRLPYLGSDRLEPRRFALRSRLQHGVRRSAVPLGPDRDGWRLQWRSGPVHVAFEGESLRLWFGSGGRHGLARCPRTCHPGPRERARHRQDPRTGPFHGGLARHGGAPRERHRGPSRPRRSSRRHHSGGPRHRPRGVPAAGGAPRLLCPCLGLRVEHRPRPDLIRHHGGSDHASVASMPVLPRGAAP